MSILIISFKGRDLAMSIHNGKEVTFSQSEFLVSTTDTNSIITYANDEFCRVAGFSAQELIGKPHNIVR